MLASSMVAGESPWGGNSGQEHSSTLASTMTPESRWRFT